LKPASKTLGLHGVFIRGKGLKYLIADSAFKRMQVDARARWLDTGEHHLGLAPGTGGAFNCSEWSDGRHALRLGHNASLPLIGGSATLSVTGNALGGSGDGPTMRLKEFQRELIRPAYGRKVGANRYSGAAGLRHQQSTRRCARDGRASDRAHDRHRLSRRSIGSVLARRQGCDCGSGRLGDEIEPHEIDRRRRA